MHFLVLFSQQMTYTNNLAEYLLDLNLYTGLHLVSNIGQGGIHANLCWSLFYLCRMYACQSWMDFKLQD